MHIWIHAYIDVFIRKERHVRVRYTYSLRRKERLAFKSACQNRWGRGWGPSSLSYRANAADRASSIVGGKIKAWVPTVSHCLLGSALLTPCLPTTRPLAPTSTVFACFFFFVVAAVRDVSCLSHFDSASSVLDHRVQLAIFSSVGKYSFSMGENDEESRSPSFFYDPNFPGKVETILFIRRDTSDFHIVCVSVCVCAVSVGLICIFLQMTKIKRYVQRHISA